MGTLEDRIREVEDEIRNTEYNKKSSHHIGKLKAKLARLREEAELARSKGGGGGRRFAVKKSGNATVALLGPPNSGKSTLLNRITEAQSEVGDFAFTTKDICPGILRHGGAQIQVLDMPGIVGGAASGRGRGREVLGMARAADLLVLFVDVLQPDLAAVLREAHESGIRPNARAPEITLSKKDRGGIDLSSTVRLTRLDEGTARGILNEFGVVNASVVFRMNATADDLIDFLSAKCAYIPAIVALNKIDLVSPEELRSRLAALDGWRVFPVSAEKGTGLEGLKKGIYEALEFRRVFLRPQGGEVDRSQPLILKRGGTVGDVCDILHKDFRRKFRYAMVWGASVRFPGQRVGLEHSLEDNDVLTVIIRL
ncbi:MAG: GTP-binding protein [Euryarchaeota archaeon]|nr:GTP-binding protein [Euryarchaeota archaeon]